MGLDIIDTNIIKMVLAAACLDYVKRRLLQDQIRASGLMPFMPYRAASDAGLPRAELLYGYLINSGTKPLPLTPTAWQEQLDEAWEATIPTDPATVKDTPDD